MQEAALNCGSRARTSGRGSRLLDRGLADTARIVSLATPETGIELDRLPVKKLKTVYARVNAALRAPERKRTGKLVEIQIAHVKDPPQEKAQRRAGQAL